MNIGWTISTLNGNDPNVINGVRVMTGNIIDRMLLDYRSKPVYKSPTKKPAYKVPTKKPIHKHLTEKPERPSSK